MNPAQTELEPLATGNADHRVAVAVPVFRPDLSAEEQLALSQLETHLSQFPRFLVEPESLGYKRKGFEVETFPDHYFTGVASYSRLLLSSDFYRRFLEYEYLLIYQLDCLVFSPDLLHWCEEGYDYLGAPWLKDPLHPQRGFSRVGNGGLSLRRVSSFLRVLEEGQPPSWWSLFSLASRHNELLPDLTDEPLGVRVRTVFRTLRNARRGSRWYAAHYTLNEDHFWSDRARLFYSGFRVAPVGSALAFSFEQAPEFCFERNANRLPFGCHAWNRFGENFWRRFLPSPSPSTSTERV